VRKNGIPIYVSLNAVPLFNKRGKYRGSMATVRDITYQKELESKLVTEKKNAECSNNFKTLFLTSVAHETRTHLNAISGFLDISLSEDDLTPAVKAYLQDAKSSSITLKRLSDDLLDFSSIQAGQFNIQKESFLLNELMMEVDSTARMLLSQYNKKNVQLRSNIPEDNAIRLKGDPKRLKQVLTNLLTNALKFTDQGFIEYGIIMKEDKFLEFYVRDTGRGISKEKQEGIFQQFNQVEEKISQRSGGIGIGLFIVKKIVEKMEGEIHLQSTYGDGSTFYFTVPFEEAINKEKEEHTELPHGGGMQILVVDDNQINQKVVTTMLSKAGYKTLSATDGKDAVSIFKSESSIDLILMDIFMPKLTGIEATEVIRKYEEEKHSSKRIPIIALTAASTSEELNEMIEAGCDGTITKPIEKEELYRILKSVFNNNR
jgi:signal transduction histidine kinase/CheY-like chemotaxis protein